MQESAFFPEFFPAPQFFPFEKLPLLPSNPATLQKLKVLLDQDPRTHYFFLKACYSAAIHNRGWFERGLKMQLTAKRRDTHPLPIQFNKILLNSGAYLYPHRVQSWNLDHAKVPGLDDRMGPNPSLNPMGVYTIL